MPATTVTPDLRDPADRPPGDGGGMPAGDPAPQPLALVGDELATTLNDARAALELYVEGDQGNAPLERCATLLHSARGVLQITETFGASLLAEEMEQACRVLLQGRRDAQPPEAMEALTRAAVQLPAYVDRVRNGGRDVPLVLLPLLNDLRAARGRPLLSESTLLLLNLGPAAGTGPGAPERTPTGESASTLAKSLRPRFQLALLGWIRGEAAGNGLGQLRSVAARLEAAARLPVVHQLWWVVGGVLEALTDGGLEASVAVKRLIGQSDRELKRLQSLGEKRFAEKPPVELVNNLLYYVARATGTGPRVTAIREAFNLSGLIPGDEQVERARASLGAPSARLMQTVAGAIREDLARVKDVLDIYVRTGMERVDELVPQVDMLKKIGDTLGVLGLGRLREEVELRRLELESLTSGRQAVDGGALLGMAAALLAIEDRLEPELLALVDPGAARPEEATPPGGAETASLVAAVMRECLANLTRVKEAISLVTERGSEPAAIDAVPGLLRGITAALLMLDRGRAARIAEGIATAAGAVVEAGVAVTPAATGDDGRTRLERLADAIVSLEYYMETLQAGRREPVYMLDNAERCLEALATSAVPVPLPHGAGEAATVVSLPGTSATSRLPLRPVPVDDRPVVSDDASRIDPEILELFIEEAREAIDTILVRFPAWELDEGDREALLTIRRAYHTLKGSGRMVGAERIGEFAWSVESLLNRVIDGTVARTPELMGFMRRAGQGIAELLEQLEVGTPPVAEISALMAEAEALARRAPEPATTPDDPGEAEVDADATGRASPQATGLAVLPAPTAPAMDPVLLDILTREVATHLATLRGYLGTTEARPGPVPEEVFRACHTLHGSLTMAGVEPGVEVAGPLHELVSLLFAAHQPADADVVAAAATAASCIEAIIAHLRDPAVPAPVPRELVGLLNDLARRVAAASALAGSETDGGTLSVRIPVLEEPADAGAVATGDETDAGPGPGALTMAVAFDAEIAGVFAEEATELLDGCDQALAQLVAGDDVDQSMEELKRALHTLKGGARMARLFALGDLSHELETLVIRLAEGTLPRDAAVLDLVRTAFDELHRLRDRIGSGDFGTVAPGLLDRLAAAQQAGPETAAALPPPTPEPAAAMSPGGWDEPVVAGPLVEPAFPPETVEEDLLPPGALFDGSGETEAAPTAAVAAAGELILDLGAADAAAPEMPADVAGEDLVATSVEGSGGPGTDLLAEVLPGAALATAAVTEATTAAAQAAEYEGVDQGETETLAAALFGPEFIAAGDDVPGLLEEHAPADAAPSPPADLPAVSMEPLAPTIEKLGELARALAAPPVPAASGPPEPAPAAAPATLPEPRPREGRELTRVDAQLLEQLLNGAGEISIANSRLNQQLTQMHFHLEELGQTVLRLRDQLRKLEMETEAQILYKHQSEAADRAGFDPLELDRYSTIQQLSRGLAETASDVSSLKDMLQGLSSDTEALVVQQARTTTELQDGLMRTRMVPFQQHAARLIRLVRQTARETGRLADLVIDGGGDLDRQVLEKLLPPFEHMLRNAVVHGIEPPAERAATGKPEAGTVRITIRREGTEVAIDVADDGRGLDVAAIRRKAVELGFVAPDAPLTDDEAMQFILRTGFSTADRLTQAAGRGIGMDVVANQVARLGGTLVIQSIAGRGTTFTLRLPLTLAVTQALIVRVGTEVYALPLATVEGIIRIPRRELDDRMDQPDASIDYGGRAYRFHYLSEFIGLPHSRLADDVERVSVILVRAGDQLAALVTDEMQDSREIVVKAVGPQLATIRGIAGATILGDGRVVMILDVAALVREGRLAPASLPPPVERPAVPVALVVDDSITMRRVTQRLLERNGFRVVTARDGLDAISVLPDHRPDIILLDVEMPRMDGYEFARHVRNQPDLAGVPIVMVTSRVSDKHRARAIEVGVNDYLGKPYQERELLQAVNALLGRS
jgi:chemosensory pili system protein ChpA (sensor histidine kinase/response regulator)